MTISVSPLFCQRSRCRMLYGVINGYERLSQAVSLSSFRLLRCAGEPLQRTNKKKLQSMSMMVDDSVHTTSPSILCMHDLITIHSN